MSKTLLIMLLSLFNVAYAVTDQEVRDLIQNTPITGEGAASESHGYEDVNTSRINDYAQTLTFNNRSNISREGLQIILKHPRRVWNYVMSNANYAFGSGTEPVTIYLAYNSGTGGRVELNLVYFTTVRTSAALFHRNMRKIHRTNEQLSAGWKQVGRYGMPLLP